MLRVTGLCAGNSLVTGEFPAQLASNAEMFPFDDVIIVYTNKELLWRDILTTFDRYVNLSIQCIGY